MSGTAEREIEVVAGVIEGVTQKKPDTWQVTVRPDGSNYSKNLWTKDAELVSSLTAKLGQHGAFVCSASYWNRQDGQQVRSLWINQESTEGVTVEPAQTRATPAAAPSSDGGMSKEEWLLKDLAIHRDSMTKAAADALKHTIPSEPSPADLRTFIENVKTLSYEWWRQVEAVRKGDDSDLPFLSEHDEEIPYA